jgi:hypothetical protein
MESDSCGRCGQSCAAGLPSLVPLFGSGTAPAPGATLHLGQPGRLGLLVVRVLGRRLAASLQQLRVAGTGIWWHALAQLEQDAPLVAEVEQIRDGAAGLEVEVPQASGGAACFAFSELVGSRELRLGRARPSGSR